MSKSDEAENLLAIAAAILNAQPPVTPPVGRRAASELSGLIVPIPRGHRRDS